jgi:hypothetical protein
MLKRELKAQPPWPVGAFAGSVESVTSFSDRVRGECVMRWGSRHHSLSRSQETGAVRQIMRRVNWLMSENARCLTDIGIPSLRGVRVDWET